MKKEPTDEEVFSYINRNRSGIRGMCIEMLVDCALVYDKERQRDDQFHEARMSKCRDTLKLCIQDAHEALYPGPVTKVDFEITKRLMMS